MKKPIFKVIIAGGRDFDQYNLLESYCKHVLKNHDKIEIVSGTAKGADELGEKFAIKNNLGLKSFPADWTNIEGKPASQIGTRKDGTKYWKAAGHARNRQMAEYADALIAFWDGKSKGTKDMINQAESLKLKVKVKIYAPRVRGNT